MQSHRSRLTALLAIVAGLGFAVEGAIVTRAPQGDSGWSASGYAVEAAFVLALIAAIPAMHLLRPAGSRAAVWATHGARGGFAALLVSAVPSLVEGKDVLGPLFLLGVLLSLVSLLVLSVVSLRRRGTGWWVAPAAFAGLVVSMALGDQGGGVVLGVAWAAIGLAALPAPGRIAVA
jgi:hypothetical protein